MAKFKFKGATVDDAEEELNRLVTLNIKEIPLSHIIKIVNVLGVEIIDGKNTGSAIRFRHKYAATYGGYFTVHRIHKGGDEVMIKKTDFKAYLIPPLRDIIEKIKREQKQ